MPQLVLLRARRCPPPSLCGPPTYVARYRQVFSGRRVLTKLLLASADLKKIEVLQGELSQLVVDMQVGAAERR